MARRTRRELKKCFKRGCYPTEAQFGDLIDSCLNLMEEKIGMTDVAGLPGALNQKASVKTVDDLKAAQTSLMKEQVVLARRLNGVAPKMLRVEDLDLMGYEDVGAFHAGMFEDDKGYTRYCVTGVIGTQIVTVGLLDVLKDSSGHVVTQMLTTKYGMKNGTLITTEHNDWDVRVYVRHFNVSQSASSAIVGLGEWSDWTDLRESAVAAAVHQALIADAAKIGATHNSATKRFTLNGLTNITDDQMRAILLFGILPPFTTYGIGDRNNSPAIRTNVLQYDGGDALRNSATMNHAFYNQTSLEVAVVSPSRTGDQTYTLSPTSIGGAFNNCTALKRILGIINLDRIADANEGWGNNCSLLEEVHFHRLKKSLNLLNLPALKAECVRELVDYAVNTDAITVSVHERVYRKLILDWDFGQTDEGIAEGHEWMNAMDAARERGITFATGWVPKQLMTEEGWYKIRHVKTGFVLGADSKDTNDVGQPSTEKQPLLLTDDSDALDRRFYIKYDGGGQHVMYAAMNHEDIRVVGCDASQVFWRSQSGTVTVDGTNRLTFWSYGPYVLIRSSESESFLGPERTNRQSRVFSYLDGAGDEMCYFKLEPVAAEQTEEPAG